MNKKNVNFLQGARKLCSPCAKDLGAVWPKGHIGTVNQEECDSCGKITLCFDSSDFLWPDRRLPDD